MSPAWKNEPYRTDVTGRIVRRYLFSKLRGKGTAWKACDWAAKEMEKNGYPRPCWI
ncbi:MAG: hypothetical protein R2941_23555 [Desulfobacterales bacterium]